MFVLLAQRLTTEGPGLCGITIGGVANLLALPTRAILAAIVSFLLAIALGPRCIAWLRQRYREPVKSASADIARLHAGKQNTPTMGGLFLVVLLILVCVVLGDITNAYLCITLATTAALCVLGSVDDWIKLRTSRRGLSPRTKFAAQVAVALVAATLIFFVHRDLGDVTKLHLPILGSFDMKGWFVPWAALVIVASSNAVNLTDGLDGLAGGCMVWSAATMAAVAAIVGDLGWASALGITHVAGAAEMVVVCAAMAGAAIAFLWFNCHPASVFMGDAGSLPLGGLLGLVAVITRQELLFVLIGGVFVVEALSVILQVCSYRWTGRRVLRCAPLHHHYQLQGWSEDKIVVRFWIAAGLCAAAGLATFVPAAAEFARLVQPAPGAAKFSEPRGQEPPTFAELF